MPRKSDTCSTTASTTISAEKGGASSGTGAAGESAASALQRGAQLARYVILDELGQGGNGIVYSAFDPDLDRKVALKVLRRSRETQARARLLREAQAMAKLSHPNVVTVFEVGTDDGRDFVSMEFVDGQNLAAWSETQRGHEEVLAVYRQAGQGLAAAHRVGLVHRDFKPHNVLLGKDGRVLVTDFGLARQASSEGALGSRHAAKGAPASTSELDVVSETASPAPSSEQGVDALDATAQAGGQNTARAATQPAAQPAAQTAVGALDATALASERVDANPGLTRTGTILGTPAYMAPEQHRAQAADARSDQYSFCVALYEALVGARPFSADDYQSLKEQVLSEKAPALPDSVALSSRVRAALARGLSISPEKRFASMEELLSLLEPEGRRRWPYAAAASLGLGALLFLGLTRPSADAASQCRPDTTVLAGSWDPELRTQVRTAFTMTQVEGSLDVLGKFESIVDAYANQLVDLRVQICRASRSQNAGDDQLTLMQMTCLQKRRQELRALTSAFANVDARGVDRALEAALALSPIGECQDAAALQRGVSGPAPEQKEEVAALQASLQSAKSQGEAGRGKSAIAQAEAARDRSLLLGYLPLQAEAQALLGQLYFEELRLADAERAYEEAILAAEESGYTEFRARALAGQTRLVASGSSRYEEARRLARRARAAIAQWGGDAELSVDVDLAMAVILRQEGRLQEALDLLQTTWRGVSASDKTTALQVARLQNRIASIKAETGKYEEAHSLASSSYELVRAELGDNNPKTIDYLSTLVVIKRMRGESDEAQKLDKRLRAYWGSEKALAQLTEDDDYKPETRSIAGTVRAADGQPAAGVLVVCNQRVLGDSRFLDVAWDARGDAVNHYAQTRSAADGGFECAMASTEEIVVAADDLKQGRSQPVVVAASSEAKSDLVLQLAATGFLAGQVSKDGGPAPAQSVTAVPIQDDMARPNVAALTFLRADGSYSFERLAPGRYKVFSGQRDSTASSVLHSLEVEIRSGQGASLDFDQSEGNAGLSLVVKGKGGASIPSAQVLLVPGHIDSQAGADFNALVLRGSVDVRSYFWTEGDTLKVGDLKPGLLSLCVVPLGGDFRDPEYMKRFDKKVLDTIPVHCQDVEVQSEAVLAMEVEVEPFRLPPPAVEAPKGKEPDEPRP